MKKFNPDELPVDEDLLEETPIHAELNIESLIFRQIERCYISTIQSEELFAANVRALLSTIPSHKQTEILDKEDEYKSIIQHYEYKYNCGVPLGTPEEPICGSPWLAEEEIIDWHKLFELILTSLEECGITWKFEKWTIEVGAVEKGKNIPPPTPIFAGKFKRPVTAEETSNGHDKEEPKKYAHICAVCGNPIEKNEGKIYNHKRVHKKDCYAIAKAKWGNGEKK